MSLPTVIVYSQSSNRNAVRLLDKGEPVRLEGVTEIELRLNTGGSISSARHPEAISWNKGHPLPEGVVYLTLGNLFFSTREYTSEVMVYDDLNYRGIFWGLIRIRAIEGEITEDDR